MEAKPPRFTLGRQSSLAPVRNDTRPSREEDEDWNGSSGGGGDYSSSGSVGKMLLLPEKLEATIQLLYLALNADVDGMEALLTGSVDVNSADFDDRTALHVAACEGNADIARFLIRKGANVNARDRWGSTPLADARHYGNMEICKILEANGAKLPEVSQKVPMKVANPTDVPEYELNPNELMNKKDLSAKHKLAKWHGTTVVVQILPDDLSTHAQSVNDFRDELALLLKLRHPNIVQFLGAVTQNTPMRIVEEYCGGGDLDAHLERMIRLDTAKAVRYAIDIARGLNYLHQCKPEPIIHRNLKPRYIMRDGMGHVKVCGFGLTTLLHETPKGGKHYSNGSCYMAPEVLRGDGYDKSVDVFSFAIILHQMIEGSSDFHCMVDKDVIDAIAHRDVRPQFKVKAKHYPEGLKELIEQCWDKDSSKRPLFSKIITELERIKPFCEKQPFWRKALGIPKRSLSLKSLSFKY